MYHQCIEYRCTVPRHQIRPLAVGHPVSPAFEELVRFMLLLEARFPLPKELMRIIWSFVDPRGVGFLLKVKAVMYPALPAPHGVKRTFSQL